MQIGLWYWVLLIVAVIVGGAGAFQPQRVPPWGLSLVVLTLFLLLGWAVFGSPVRG